jgi:hypothetical protein
MPEGYILGWASNSPALWDLRIFKNIPLGFMLGRDLFEHDPFEYLDLGLCLMPYIKTCVYKANSIRLDV